MSDRPLRGGDPADEPGDPRLAALYRAAAAGEPPAHLDAVVRAAARRGAAAGPRRPAARFLQAWRMPVAIAAVVALSVSLVTLMWEEHGGRLAGPPRDAAEAVREQPPAPIDPAPAPAKQAPAARSKTEDVRPHRFAEIAPRRAEPSRTDTDRLESTVPGPEISTARRAGPREELRRQDTAASSEPPPAGIPGTTPDRSSEATGMMEKGTPVPFAAAPAPAAKPAPRKSDLLREYEDEPPQKWLEKVAELRREGRRADADELLEAFRQRFPDHPLPVELR